MRRAVTIASSLACVAALAMPAGGAQQDVRIAPTAPGGVFVEGVVPSFELEGSGARWVVRDHLGKEVAAVRRRAPLGSTWRSPLRATTS